MNTSNFQFSDPILTHLEFIINKAFMTKEKETNINLSFNVEVKLPSEHNEAIVELTIEVGDEKGTTPFFIRATEGAKFKWGDDLSVSVDDLLKQNAPALLLGYLRPIVASITVASPFNAYNIPFIDFSQS